MQRPWRVPRPGWRLAEAQRTEQAERSKQLQQELAAAVAGREAADHKLAELESQLLAATLQHKVLSRQHESAQQGSRELQAQLDSGTGCP